MFKNVRRALGGGARDLPLQQLEADYSFAWNSLIGLLLNGTEVDNLAAWLTTTTTRRAIDYVRSNHSGDIPLYEEDGANDHDLVASVAEDRETVRNVMDAIQHRFGKTEAEILFCLYVLDMRREEIASHLDISVKRLHKILDGHNGKPGLRAELDSHIDVIESGAWCAEHSSLISAYVLGWFGPDNPKARQARAHLDTCPACRSYANAKRGIAALLPPLTPAIFHADRASTWLEQLTAPIHALTRTIGEKLGLASTSDAASGAGAAVGGGTVAVGGIAGAKIACLSIAAVGTAACVAAITLGPLNLGASQARGTVHAAQHVRVAQTPATVAGLTVASPLPQRTVGTLPARPIQHRAARSTNNEFSIEDSGAARTQTAQQSTAHSTEPAPASAPSTTTKPAPRATAPSCEFTFECSSGGRIGP